MIALCAQAMKEEEWWVTHQRKESLLDRTARFVPARYKFAEKAFLIRNPAVLVKI